MWWLLLSCFETVNGEESVGVEGMVINTNEVEKVGLNPTVFALAQQAHQKALEQGKVDSSLVTIVDLSVHSKQERLWTIDLSKGVLEHKLVVSHGRNSDGNHDGLADSVSNVPESKQSSVGVYRTAEVYTGKHGRSLRLDGLEKGFNHNARKRAIVIHGADYATAAYVKKYGKAGRSFGCPAVSTASSDALIDTIKDGTLLFVYYPDETWLAQSTYLD